LTRWRSVRSWARAGARIGSAWTKPNVSMARFSVVGPNRLRPTAKLRRSLSVMRLFYAGALAKIEEQRQAQRDADHQIGGHRGPKMPDAAAPPIDRDERPQRQ